MRYLLFIVLLVVVLISAGEFIGLLHHPQVVPIIVNGPKSVFEGADFFTPNLRHNSKKLIPQCC